MTLCCSNPFAFEMLMTCGEFPSWSGGGVCGTQTFQITVELTDNVLAGGCQIRVSWSSANSGAVNQYYAFTGFPITLVFVDSLGISFSVLIGASIGIAHPWNNQVCNPCICARCLPAAFCVYLSRTAGTGPPSICVPCSGIVTVPLNNCATGTGSIICKNDTYTVTINLPAIEEKRCDLEVRVVGPDFDKTFVLDIERSTTAGDCYECFQGATLVSRFGACEGGKTGSGKTTMGPLSVDQIFENIGTALDDVRVVITPMWCGSCVPKVWSGCDGACPSIEHQIPQCNPVTIFGEIIAPGCVFGGQTFTMTQIGQDAADLIVPNYDPTTSCQEYAINSGMGNTINLNCDGLQFKAVLFYVHDNCTGHTNIDMTKYKLYVLIGGTCLAMISAPSISTTLAVNYGATCQPFRLDFVINLSSLVQFPCSCCTDGNSQATIRLTL
jgi:hypothetical protein